MTTQDIGIKRTRIDASSADAVHPFARIAATLALWRARAKGRAELATLGETMRKDIGVSHADIWRETQKPFWRG